MSTRPPAYACVDIGSNTTRLLVAEVGPAGLRELASRRAFTRIGAALAEGALPPAKVAEVADVVAAHVGEARALGAQAIAVVATAAIRESRNAAALADAVVSSSGVPLRILSADEEGRFSFAGAVGALREPLAGSLAVADVGGGSTEIVVGTGDAGPGWTVSLRIGSGLLADAHFRSDPPSGAELDAARADVARAFEGLAVPTADRALAVGGTATSLSRLVGPSLDRETLGRSLALLTCARATTIAERHGLEPERVRLLPAGMVVLQAVSELLGQPLEIAGGGLREGVLLGLAGNGPTGPSPAPA